MLSFAGRKEGGKVVLTNKNLVFVFARPPRQVVALRSISNVESAREELVLRSADAEIARFGIYEKDQRDAWIKDIENARVLAEQSGESIEEELSAVPEGPAMAAVAADYTSEGQMGVLFFAIGGTMLLWAYFWILQSNAGFGNNTLGGGWVQYGLAFLVLLLIGSGLHGILKSAVH